MMLYLPICFLLNRNKKFLNRTVFSLLKTETINFDLAKYCFSHAKYFNFRSNNQTSELSMQTLVEHFNEEFETEIKKHVC